MYKCIGLCDADLLDNGTRHPNLVLMKIAGFLFDNHILFELILDSKANLDRYEHVFMSRVFTFTQLPEFYTKAIGTSDEAKFHIGGTGFYANETNVKEYRKKREEDFFRLDNDKYLNTLDNHRGGHKTKGLDMARQKPSHISVVFHVDKIRYTYTLEWDCKTIQTEVLKKQMGRKDDEIVFERKFDAARDVVEITFNDKCKLSDDTKRIIRENVIRNTTVISVYDNKNFEAQDIAAVHRYFEVPLHFYGLDDERLDLCSMLTRRANADQIHDLLISMLNCVGSNIRDYKVDTTKRKLDPEFAEFLRAKLTPEEYAERFPDNMETSQYLRFAHYNNDVDETATYPYIWLTEGEESRGTLNMIRLMIILIDAANTNALATIDECAMGIHQETFNRIIQFYLSISNGSQVFLATQALPVLDMDGFRRDTARFFDKDFKTGVSTVEAIDLRKFHANKNIYKNYVDHAFGGKPTVPSNEEWILKLQEFKSEIGEGLVTNK